MNDLKINSSKFLFNPVSFTSDLESNLDQLSLTCFDVNYDVIVFGSSHGLIYVYKKGGQDTFTLIYQKDLKIGFIKQINLIDLESAVLMTNDGFSVVNFAGDFLIYKCQSSESSTRFTCIKVINDILNDQLLVLSGDSKGILCRHDIINNIAHTIFEEDQNQTNHYHEVVQIDGINDKCILISTCFRSLILKNDEQIYQIGKNIRKNCGQYGAVFDTNSGLIFASRPSLHFIKANLSDGNVIETFRVKKASPTFDLSLFQECESKSNQVGQLGYLINLQDGQNSYLISWNGQSFVIVKANGLVIVKETFIKKIIDCRVLDNQIFLLFEDKNLLTLTFDLIKNEYNSKKLTLNFNKFKNDLMKETEFILNREMFYPLAVKAMSRIEEEFNKIHSIIQTKLTKEDNWNKSESNLQLLSSDSTSENVRNDFLFEENDSNMPLVIHKKTRKKVKNFKLNLFETKSDSDPFSSSSLSTEESRSDFSSNSNIYNVLQLTDSTEVTHSSESFHSVSISDQNESNHDSLWSEDIKSIDVNEHTKPTVYNDQPSSSDTVENENRNYDVKNDNNDNSDSNNDNDWDNKQQHQINFKMNESSWKMVLNKIKDESKVKLNLICASAFNDQIDSSTIWLSSFTDQKSNLYYIPLFESFTCPRPKSKIISITCCTFNLLLLFEDNTLWMRKNMSPCRPLGCKWIKISKVPTRLVQLSANQSDLICWCCDDKGQAWILNLESLTWYLVEDKSIHIKNISVSCQDSSLVWCLDHNGAFYKRIGILNVYGAINDLIAGTSWLQFKTPFQSTLTTVTSKNVWIINQKTNQIACKIVTDPPSEFNENEWQEIKSFVLADDDSVLSLSGSSNDDVWFLTKHNVIWRWNSNNQQLSEENLDEGWCLL